MTPSKDTQRRHAWLYGLACFLCIDAVSAPAAAAIAWKRVGTVSTLTPTQLCKTDGELIICDGTTPTISATNQVGIGTATPQSLLSIYGGGLALGSYAATTTIGTGSMVASGNIGIGTSLPLVTLDLSKRTDALALASGNTSQEPTNSINGMIRYNTTLTDVEAYIGGYWTTLTTGGTGSIIYLGTSVLVPNLPASASDTQTGFYTAGTGKVDVTSQGTQVVEISTSGLNVVTGKVGIGTSVVGSVLTVLSNNSALTTTEGNSSGFRVTTGSNSNSLYMSIDGTANLGFIEASRAGVGEPLIFQPRAEGGATVGIGTTTPKSMLDVFGGVAIGTSFAGVTAAPSSGLIVQGNVGIGTTSPSNTLDVSGGVAIGTQYVGVTTAPVSGLLVQGNVGVGTTSANAPLDVWGTNGIRSSRASTQYIYMFGGDSTNQGTYLYGLSGQGNKKSLFVGALNNGIGTPSGGNNIIFQTGLASSPSEMMRITEAGNVGIGTAAPSNKLDVSGAVAIGAQYVGVTTAPASGLLVQGNVGIGTTSPAYSLQANGAIVSGVGTSGSAGTLGILPNNSASYFWIDNPGLNYLRFSNGASAGLNGIVVISNLGSVGIGTTSPSNKLDVSGGVAIGTQYVGVTTAPTSGLLVQGNVGIGTNSPAGVLDVWSGGRDFLIGPTGTITRIFGAPVTTRNDQWWLNSGGTVSFGNLSNNVIAATRVFGAQSTSSWLSLQSTTGIGTSDYINFLVGNNGGTEAMRIVDSGRIGIGTTAPSNKLDVSGGEAIGASYVGSSTAPANGMIVQGNVGIGTTTVPTGPTVAVNGSVQVAGAGTEPCTTATVGQMRFNAAGGYMEICTFDH